MIHFTIPLLLLAAMQSAPPAEKPVAAATESPFAPAIRLTDGGAPLGSDRSFPSPVLQDMNADGVPDLVIGDLWGKLTVSLQIREKGANRWTHDTPLLDADGAELDFHNW